MAGRPEAVCHPVGGEQGARQAAGLVRGPLFVRVRQLCSRPTSPLTLAERLKTWFQLTESISTLNREAIPEGARFSLVMESPSASASWASCPRPSTEVPPFRGQDAGLGSPLPQRHRQRGGGPRLLRPGDPGRSHARVNRLPYYIDHARCCSAIVPWCSCARITPARADVVADPLSGLPPGERGVGGQRQLGTGRSAGGRRPQAAGAHHGGELRAGAAYRRQRATS